MGQLGGAGLEQIFFLIAGIVMFGFAAKRLFGRQKSWKKPDAVDPELEKIRQERIEAQRLAEEEAQRDIEREAQEAKSTESDGLQDNQSSTWLG